MYYDGLKLRNAIARKQMSVEQFAKDAGLSRFTTYRALADGRAYTKSLGKIAAALGVENPCDLCKSQATANAM